MLSREVPPRCIASLIPPISSCLTRLTLTLLLNIPHSIITIALNPYKEFNLHIIAVLLIENFIYNYAIFNQPNEISLISYYYFTQ